VVVLRRILVGDAEADVMKIDCLMGTYGRHALACESLACFLQHRSFRTRPCLSTTNTRFRFALIIRGSAL
jgi:hypothetical protein